MKGTIRVRLGIKVVEHDEEMRIVRRNEISSASFAFGVTGNVAYEVI